MSCSNFTRAQMTLADLVAGHADEAMETKSDTCRVSLQLTCDPWNSVLYWGMEARVVITTLPRALTLCLILVSKETIKKHIFGAHFVRACIKEREFVGHFVITVFLYKQVVSPEVLRVHNPLLWITNNYWFPCLNSFICFGPIKFGRINIWEGEMCGFIGQSVNTASYWGSLYTNCLSDE